MKLIKIGLTPIVILCAFIIFPSCKAKKLAQKPAQPTAAATPPPAPAVAPKPLVAQTPTPAAPAAPNYNFSNIQFDFDSSILKTSSYPILDQVAADMKANPSIDFDLNGYASIEGTAEHNLMLSNDRANAVKTYLVNTGVKSTNIIAKGFGTSNPIGDNTTDDGRILNRRVEVHLQN